MKIYLLLHSIHDRIVSLCSCNIKLILVLSQCSVYYVQYHDKCLYVYISEDSNSTILNKRHDKEKYHHSINT